MLRCMLLRRRYDRLRCNLVSGLMCDLCAVDVHKSENGLVSKRSDTMRSKFHSVSIQSGRLSFYIDMYCLTTILLGAEQKGIVK